MLTSYNPAPQARSIQSCRLLIVAQAGEVSDLEPLLREAGFAAVEFATGGRQALVLLRTFPPDLILLDLAMFERIRTEISQEVQQNPALEHLRILVVTGPEDPGQPAEILAAGVSDVISRPFQPRDLLTRIRIHLENRALAGSLRDLREHTARELAAAREMQDGLLPTAAELDRIARRYGTRIAATVRPCDDLGGDSWTVWQISRTKLGLLALDVAGHGTIAAINAFRLHTLLQHLQAEQDRPGRLLARLNDQLVTLLRPGQFVTMFSAVIDVAAGNITYAGAGSPPALLRHAGGGRVTLDGAGVPLGIVAGQSYPDHAVPFSAGSRLMFASDALSEAPVAGGILGEARAGAILNAAMEFAGAGGCFSEDAVREVCTKLELLQHGRLPDDLTVIAIEQMENPHTPQADPAPGTAVRPARALVIEIVAAQRAITAQVAEAAGLIVDAARDLAEAAQLLGEHCYDFILLDPFQIESDGLEFDAPFGATAGRPSLILLDGDTSAPISDAAVGLAETIGLGIGAVLAKPLQLDALRRVLSTGSEAAPLSGAGASTVRIRPADFAGGLEAGEILPVFQPEVELASGKPFGIEALARWVSGKFGSVPPLVFLPLADQAGAGGRLTELILDGALGACAASRQLLPLLTVSLNFTPAMLQSTELAPRLLRQLEQFGLPPEALMIEIAEPDLPQAAEAAAALHRAGIRVAVDDFGTGHTSIQVLNRIEPSRIKFDPGLIRRLPHDAVARRMVLNLCRVSGSMGFEMVAKGVENTATRDQLLELGCTLGMGWLYGRAMPDQVLKRWLAAGSAGEEEKPGASSLVPRAARPSF